MSLTINSDKIKRVNAKITLFQLIESKSFFNLKSALKKLRIILKNPIKAVRKTNSLSKKKLIGKISNERKNILIIVSVKKYFWLILIFILAERLK